MRKIVIGMAMASTALTAPAMAREGQWYIEGNAGAMLVEQSGVDVAGVEDSARIKYNTGYDVGGIVGHDFGPFRLEAEASYRRARMDNVVTGPTGLFRHRLLVAPLCGSSRGGRKRQCAELHAQRFD
jgi:OmpA-OmpF porin, OOP family